MTKHYIRDFLTVCTKTVHMVTYSRYGTSPYLLFSISQQAFFLRSQYLSHWAQMS